MLTETDDPECRPAFHLSDGGDQRHDALMETNADPLDRLLILYLLRLFMDGQRNERLGPLRECFRFSFRTSRFFSRINPLQRCKCQTSGTLSSRSR